MCGQLRGDMVEAPPTRENLSDLADSILDAYAVRVETINALMTQAYFFLCAYQDELEDMMRRLQENLAKVGSLRKVDFERMTKDVLASQATQARNVKACLQSFQAEENEMIRRLKAILRQQGEDRINNIKVIRQDIFRRQKDREQVILMSLKEFQISQEELRESVKPLLRKGDRIKLQDFRDMLRALKTHQARKDNDILNTLQALGTVREKVRSRWQAVLGG
jgi:PHD/YefM family antitoxin component YafN of YafNO toxin-antitoxin module